MAFIQVPPDSTGKKVDTTTDGTAQRQVVNIGEDFSGGTAIAPVSATNGLAVDAKTLAPDAATQTTLAAIGAQSLDYDTGGGTAAQVIFGVALPASGGPVAGGTATNPFRMDPTGSTTQPVSGTVTASNTTGNVANDSADSGNPVKVGGRAVSAEPTPVTAGDRSDFITDLTNKQIIAPYTNPENLVSGCITSAMTGTTSTSLVAAPAAGLRNYLTQITVSNTHASVSTNLELQDGNAGTTFYIIPAAAVYGGATISFPAPLRQPTTATAIYIKNSTTGASTFASASGYKGA